MRRHLITLFMLTGGWVTAWSQSSTTVNWYNSTISPLRDMAGNPLTQGNAVLNCDGTLIQLGYFTSATTANKFSGTWVPLTGAPGRPRTTIGDSFDLNGSGDGVAQFNTFFQSGTATIEVYDESDGGHYQTQSSVGISSTTPPDNQILAIRFYDTADGRSGHYNTVSSDTWRWKAPALFGSIVQIDFSNSTLAFQDPNRALRTAIPIEARGQLANISSRLSVGIGDNVLIGGFIITGPEPKKLIVRAIGPSLAIPGALADPALEIFNESGTVIASNDNWKTTQQQEIINTTIPPSNEKEAAIVAMLDAGAYTSMLRGVKGATGVALVEVYDLARKADSSLGNISTRGFVQTGDNVLIGGVIVTGTTPLRVIIRAIGPSLSLPNKLEDPTLELFNRNGSALAFNDNWRESQETEIAETTVPPQKDLESAIVATLEAGNYTAVVRGRRDSTGVALVEVYALR